MFIIHWASGLRTVILWLWQILCYYFLGASLVAQMVKISCNAGDPGSIPGLGRSPGEGNGNPLQDSCLENPMDRGAWQTTVHGVGVGYNWVTNTHTHYFLRYWFCPIFYLLSHTEAQIKWILILNLLLSSVCFSFILPELNSGLLTYLPFRSSFSSFVLILLKLPTRFFVCNFHLYNFYLLLCHI